MISRWALVVPDLLPTLSERDKPEDNKARMIFTRVKLNLITDAATNETVHTHTHSYLFGSLQTNSKYVCLMRN